MSGGDVIKGIPGHMEAVSSNHQSRIKKKAKGYDNIMADLFNIEEKHIYIPCIKEELDKREVAHNEGKKVGELVDLLQENEGDEKIFRPKMNIWQAMALLDD